MFAAFYYLRNISQEKIDNGEDMTGEEVTRPEGEDVTGGGGLAIEGHPEVDEVVDGQQRE